MERRGFLKGLFGGVTSAGLLIAAKPADIEAFTAPLAKQEPLIIDSPPVDPRIGPGEHLYNSRGECVAIVTELNVSRDLELWHSISGDAGFVRGISRFELRAVGIGTVRLGPTGPSLRGINR
jgi:hypothetical protein